MIVVEPYAHIQTPFLFSGIDLLRKIEAIARISHRTEDRVTEDSWEVFIRKVVLNHGDWSVTEHASATVVAEVDRGITHEWVRHRLFSYTQESTRFVNYDKPGFEARFINPGFEVGKPEYEQWVRAMISAEAYYKSLLKYAPPQLARTALPNGLASKVVVTGNLRNWRHFFVMRTCREAHPQMRQVTIPLLEEFKEKIPILYEDIEPGMKQSEAMKLAR